MPDELITQSAAATLRGVTLAAINDLVRRGRLRSIERYGKVLVYRADVESFAPVRAGWPKGKARKAASTERRASEAASAGNGRSGRKKGGKK